MHARRSPLLASILLALSAATATSLTACGGPSAPAPEAPPPATAAAPAASEVPAAPAAGQDAATAAADREAELKAKEVELQLREQAVADREAAAAASTAAASKAKPARPAATPQPVASAPAPAAAPPPPPVTVPAGTPVAVKLSSGYSSRATALGEAVNAELASDLVVGGRVVARAGAAISGTVTEVTSGSHKIGAVPALRIDFTQLVAADGRTLPVAIRINQKGQSEKGRDTAKIVGGTAAGAIIGHQIDDGKGKVIGGIIGGAAGAVGAHKTGTEVELAAGTVVAASVRTAFTYDGR